MGFSSIDNLIQKVSQDGQMVRTDWNKNFLPTTAAVAGEWHNLARGGGNPAADSLYNTGTNLTFQAVSDATTNSGGMIHGGNVSPATKHILNASAFSAAATTTPCILMLVDLVGFYRVTTVTTLTAQSLTNTISTTTNVFTADDGTDTLTHTFYNLFPYTRVRLTTSGTLPTGLSLATDYYVIQVTATTCKLATSYANAVAGTAIDITDAGSGTHTLNTVLPRYTSGAGLRPIMWNTNATPLGAGVPNLSIGYTNSAQATGRATPTVLPIGKTAAANGLIMYSGSGNGKYGPFMPLQSADAGVAEINTVTLSASYVSGEFSIGLCKPLMTIPLTASGVATERDLVNQLPSMPRVYDGANLVWLMYSGVATPVNSALFGHLDFGWA